MVFGMAAQVAFTDGYFGSVGTAREVQTAEMLNTNKPFVSY